MPEESSTSFAGPNRSRFEGLRPFRTLSADALPCRSSKASISCAGVSTGRAFSVPNSGCRPRKRCLTHRRTSGGTEKR